MTNENKQNFTILYKCNRCSKVSQELQLYCYFCGARLVNKGVIINEEDNNVKN